MCGFTGFLDNQDSDIQVLMKMTDQISHRGPDAEGHWCFENIGFGHRRLSILDLSPTGAQPMSSASERYVLIFNGEIYNYETLRKRFDNFSWKGTSDTEVFLEYIETFGIQKALEDSCGMFAFALWDKKEKTLTLARDAMGEKPLYYGESGGTFFFGSELKSFIPHPNFKKIVDQRVVNLFFKYNCVPGEFCIFQGIQKLKPGTYKTFNQQGKELDSKEFFSLKKVSNHSSKNLYKSIPEASKDIEDTLKEVLTEMMRTDVPYGSFLSSGIDSSLITALMQEISSDPINTFSIGFEDKQFDESEGAEKIASTIGTKHTSLICRPKDSLNLVEKLPEIYCEPFSDSSQLPTLLVSELAKKHVTVCLSGDGGDELFAGYNRHQWIPFIYNKTKGYPNFLRQMASSGIKVLGPNTWNEIGKLGAQISKLNINRAGDKLYQISEILKCPNQRSIYDYLTSHWEEPLVRSQDFFEDQSEWNEHLIQESQVLFADQMGYLNHDILVKVDRAAMRNSLEVRVPFIDKRVVEAAWRIPFEYNRHESKIQGKQILRRILFDKVDKSHFDGVKKGFTVPLEDWLRVELKDWTHSLLSKEKLNDAGLKEEIILKRFDEHKRGTRNWHFHLWDVLMYMSWREKYLN